ncbi:MAG: helix-turn-helix transcriptional regulator [Pirellulaceae bacterium]|nr:helix-turn-helix domain-containing protein [Planctomycetales bacterium]
MAWKKKPSQRSYRCNGELIAARRIGRDWSQAELGIRAGYSARLVAKAEAGEKIATQTIDDIATALSTPDEPLYPEDLICNPKGLALEFVENLKRYQGDVVTHCRHFLSDDIEFFMPGDPQILPFAGRHVGIEAMDRACRLFFECVEIVDMDRWTTDFTITDGNQVVVAQWIPAQARGLAAKGLIAEKTELVVYRMVFERGMIVLFDDQYSAHSAEAEWLMQQAMLKAAESTAG